MPDPPAGDLSGGVGAPDAVSAAFLPIDFFVLVVGVFGVLQMSAQGWFPPADLLTGIRAVAVGDAVVAPSVTRRLIDAFADHLPDPTTGRSPTDERLSHLTEREREVLVELARGRSARSASRIAGPNSPVRGCAGDVVLLSTYFVAGGGVHDRHAFGESGSCQRRME